MNTRRKFLLKGSMATTALLTAKPFKTLANTLSPVTGYSVNDNKIVLVHTGSCKSTNPQQTVDQIRSLKQNIANMVLLNAGDTQDSTQLKYDALINNDGTVIPGSADYNIVYKGNIKIGIVKAAGTAGSTAENINALAGYLKKDKHCQMVVCLSQLGFRSAAGLNDINLAACSANIDIIIGGHSTDFCKRPTTALNKNKEEVIIHHAADQGLALRKLEIEFDSYGRKKHIAFTRTIPVSQAS